MFRKFLALSAALVAWPGVAGAQYIGADPPPPPPAAPLAGQFESPQAKLAREVRLLALAPRSFEALIGAGRASLDVGDPQAAVGFFGRAEEVSPSSPLPKAGMGTALAQIGEPARALGYFTRAQQLGAPVASFALDRGQAYDLLGNQAAAQSDYRIALAGGNPNEARRRLALSLAISGKRVEALTALEPLLARRDPGALRDRAFVLAMTGDQGGAIAAVNGAMPGMASSMAPFMARLAGLSASDKASAVFLGVFPGDAGGSAGSVAVASSTPPSYSAPSRGEGADRLSQIDSWLRAAPSPQSGAAYGPPASPAPAPVVSAPVEVASVAPPPSPVRSAPVLTAPRASAAQAAAAAPRKLWIQLASGPNESALGAEYSRISKRDPELFADLSPYVTLDGNRARLLIGPFKNRDDVEIFSQELEASRIPGFSWTNDQGQVVRKLSQ